MEAVRYQWELIREVTSSLHMKSDYQVRVIKIKQYGIGYHLEKYRDSNTNCTMLFPSNEVVHDKSRK